MPWRDCSYKVSCVTSFTLIFQHVLIMLLFLKLRNSMQYRYSVKVFILVGHIIMAQFLKVDILSISDISNINQWLTLFFLIFLPHFLFILNPKTVKYSELQYFSSQLVNIITYWNNIAYCSIRYTKNSFWIFKSWLHKH